MTITESDLKDFESARQEFDPQPTPDSCLPIGLKNILDELSNRHNVSDLSLAEKELKEITEYEQGFGGSSENVAPVLGAELEEYGYTVKEQINTTLKELDEVINRGTASLPIVELNPDYFDLIDNWNPQPGKRGYNFPHIITPCKINSEKILYYDPFEEMMVKSGRVDIVKNKLNQHQFFDLWNDAPHPRWTMWVEQLEQQTLQASVRTKS